ncbi:BCCT family transporter [Alkalihalobacterium alkalinitrilicum]|uniref:BCCT family transporter n=1 Tax=Alkalihalobacterium alkalinitrilicum TaxID=427920 RepID=UPI000995604E|nr:BCCT family transporter [Alkalihalobacterium alkalinitrilicum]
MGVLFVPALGSVLWFTVFGGTALYQEIHWGVEMANTIRETPESGLFLMLGQLPFGLILSIAALVLITIFFITSANSANKRSNKWTPGVHPSPVEKRPFPKPFIICIRGCLEA